MPLKHDVKSITYLKTRTAELVGEVAEGARQVTITQSGDPKVVMMDVATYERWRAALGLHKILSHAEADVEAGRTVSQQEAFRRAEALVAESALDE